VTITEPGIAATPTDSEGNKTTDAEIEGGNFTTTTDEGTAHLEPTTTNCGNGPQPIVTGERRMNSSYKRCQLIMWQRPLEWKKVS